MGAMVAYTFLLNIALNYDQPLLRRLAGEVTDAHGAGILVGHYDGLRTLALLPYQALLVITFVVFPLVSRSTFTDDREATRAYVSQTLRYALILVAAMGLCLAARPGDAAGDRLPARLRRGRGRAADPGAGRVLPGDARRLVRDPQRRRARGAAIALMALTVAVGVGAAFLLVPNAAPGPAMLMAAATATASGTVVGFVAAVIYVRQRLGGGLPPASALRVGDQRRARGRRRALPASARQDPGPGGHRRRRRGLRGRVAGDRRARRRRPREAGQDCAATLMRRRVVA